MTQPVPPFPALIAELQAKLAQGKKLTHEEYERILAWRMCEHFGSTDPNKIRRAELLARHLHKATSVPKIGRPPKKKEPAQTPAGDDPGFVMPPMPK